MSKLLSIKYTTSKTDTNGNSYSAVTVTNLLTGKTAIARTAASSNDRSSMYYLFGEDWENVRKYCIEYEEVLGVREFNRFVKGMPYAGCGPDQITHWIKEAIGFEFDATYAPGREVLIQLPRQNVSFRTTIQQIRDGVGQHTKFNADLREALATCKFNGIVGITYGDEKEFQLSLL